MVQLEDEVAPIMHPERDQSSRAVHILVVDDEEDIRDVLRAFLEARGYDVMVAENGPTALKCAEHFPGSIDLLITDLRMPNMDGIELARQMRTHRSEIRVLHMSAHVDELATSGKLKPNANIIAKPFLPANLSEKVSHILAR